MTSSRTWSWEGGWPTASTPHATHHTLRGAVLLAQPGARLTSPRLSASRTYVPSECRDGVSIPRPFLGFLLQHVCHSLRNHVPVLRGQHDVIVVWSKSETTLLVVGRVSRNLGGRSLMAAPLEIRNRYFAAFFGAACCMLLVQFMPQSETCVCFVGKGWSFRWAPAWTCAGECPWRLYLALDAIDGAWPSSP